MLLFLGFAIVLPILAFTGILILIGVRRFRGAALKATAELAVCCAAIFILSLMSPRNEWPLSRDTVHSFEKGRFQIWKADDGGYVFTDEANPSATDRSVDGVAKWAERQTACCLMTRSGNFVVVDKKDGSKNSYAGIDSVPAQYRKTFREMKYWSPYGQLWEDASHIHWSRLLAAVAFVMFILRFAYLLGFHNGNSR